MHYSTAATGARPRDRLLVLLAAAFLAGCATKSKVRNAPPETGVQRAFPSGVARIKRAALESLAQAAFTVREESALEEGRHRLLATQGLSAGTIGRIARVLLQPQGADTLVSVLVESKLDTADARAGDHAIAEDLLKRIAANMAAPGTKVSPAESATSDDVEKTYAATLDASTDAVTRACRERHFRIERSGGGAEVRTVRGEGRGGATLFVALYRRELGRSRIVIQVRGGSSSANRDEARALHEKLKETLKETD